MWRKLDPITKQTVVGVAASAITTIVALVLRITGDEVTKPEAAVMLTVALLAIGVIILTARRYGANKPKD